MVLIKIAWFSKHQQKAMFNTQASQSTEATQIFTNVTAASNQNET